MTAPRRDIGLTMIELTVAIVIAGSVLALAAGVVFSAINAGRSVQSGSITGSQAQVAADTITDRVANGSDAVILRGADQGDQLLVVRAAGTEAQLSWRCHAWYFRAVDGALLATDRRTGPPHITAPTRSDSGDWRVLATALRPSLADGIFEFAGREVRIGFEIDDGRTATRIATGAVLRNASAATAGGSEQCF